MADVYVVLGVIGNIIALLMFLSPTPIIWGIIISQDTGLFSPVPYACALLNCMLWFFYGLPAVTNVNSLLITNSAGIIVECIYLVIFCTFATPANRGFLSALLVLVTSTFAIAVVVALSVFKQDERAFFVGVLCVVVNTLMYASPLSVLATVIRSQIADAMPYSLSLCSLINALVWAVYGVLKHDTFMIIPNTLGAILAIIQLVIYFYFKNDSESDSYQTIPDGKLKHSKSANSYLK